MPKAAELKKGMIVEINNRHYAVKDVVVQSPSSRSGTTLYKVRYAEVPSQQKFDQSYTGDDFLKEVDLARRNVQFLYLEGTIYTFMDSEDYSQYSLDAETLDEMATWLKDGLEGIQILLIEGNPVGIILPATVTAEVLETAPSLKGGSATARTKPATVYNGIVVQVPDYIENGEVIKINTESGKFMSRA